MNKREKIPNQLTLIDVTPKQQDDAFGVELVREDVTRAIEPRMELSGDLYEIQKDEMVSYVPNAISIMSNPLSSLARKILFVILYKLKSEMSLETQVPTGELRFKIPQVYKILGNPNTSSIDNATKELLKLIFGYTDYKGSGANPELDVFDNMNLFSRMRYERGSLFVILNKESNPLWLRLSSGYTPFLLRIYMELTGKYSMALYTLIAKHRNNRIRLSWAQLRELVGMDPDVFSDWRDFNKRVLKLSQKEIEEKTSRKLLYKVVSGARNPEYDKKIIEISGEINWGKLGNWEESIRTAYTNLRYDTHANGTHIADWVIKNPKEFAKTYNEMVLKHKVTNGFTPQNWKWLGEVIYKELGIN